MIWGAPSDAMSVALARRGSQAHKGGREGLVPRGGGEFSGMCLLEVLSRLHARVFCVYVAVSSA